MHCLGIVRIFIADRDENVVCSLTSVAGTTASACHQEWDERRNALVNRKLAAARRADPSSNPRGRITGVA